MAELVGMRQAYGEALLKLGEERTDVVVLSADVANSDYSFMFGDKYPQRFFNVGIAEPALVDMAVGFAYTGKIPFANTFACFFATRAVEMIRTHCCYGRANVKLMGAYAGLSDSFDGPTHHSITDLAIMRALPGMTVVVPGDPVSVGQLLPQVADWDGPVYMRHSRNEAPVLFGYDYRPVIGEAGRVREGDDVSIIACGIPLARALEAARVLARSGVEARVLDMHTVKPLDANAVLDAARDTGAIVTVEEHSVIGGLGAAVTETVCAEHPVPVIRVGVQDEFAETGPYEAILDRYGLSVDAIVNAAEASIRMKQRTE